MLLNCVLEKTLQSPLGSKEIKPVNPKGNQPWIFISPPSEFSGLISFRTTGLISLLSKGLSRVFSSTTGRKHQFFGAQPSLPQLLHQTLLDMISPTLVYYCMDCSRVIPLFVTSTPMVRNISSIHHPYIELLISSVQVK